MDHHLQHCDSYSVSCPTLIHISTKPRFCMVRCGLGTSLLLLFWYYCEIPCEETQHGDYSQGHGCQCGDSRVQSSHCMGSLQSSTSQFFGNHHDHHIPEYQVAKAFLACARFQRIQRCGETVEYFFLPVCCHPIPFLSFVPFLNNRIVNQVPIALRVVELLGLVIFTFSLISHVMFCGELSPQSVDAAGDVDDDSQKWNRYSNILNFSK